MSRPPCSIFRLVPRPIDRQTPRRLAVGNRSDGYTEPMLLILAILIALLAIAGGIVITKFIFLVLLIALFLAAISALRRA